MYSNDYSAYPQIFGSMIAIAVISGGLIAFILNDTLRRWCARAYFLIPALAMLYILAKEQVTDLYLIGLSVLGTLFFVTVWGLPALVSYTLIRCYRGRQ